MIEVVTETMSELFTKYHLKGLPFDAVLHKFTAIHGDNAHDHPFSFTTHILKGGYTERIYKIWPDGLVTSTEHWRGPGTVSRVEAGTIHEIIHLPEECWTLILPEEKTQEFSFYDFSGDVPKKRFWYEEQFSEFSLAGFTNF